MVVTTRKQFIKGVGGAALGLVAVSGVSGLLGLVQDQKNPYNGHGHTRSWMLSV